MSLPHHDNPDDSRLIEMFRQQQQGTKQRQWPNGRLSKDDDGEIAFLVKADEDLQLVTIDFGKQVTSISGSPEQIVELAQLLIKQARAIAKAPLRLTLY